MAFPNTCITTITERTLAVAAAMVLVAEVAAEAAAVVVTWG